jgi:hypothetical protein
VADCVDVLTTLFAFSAPSKGQHDCPRCVASPRKKTPKKMALSAGDGGTGPPSILYGNNAVVGAVQLESSVDP